MTSEVDKILARVAQVAESNPIARDILEQRQVVGQQLPEGMQPHPEYRFNPTTDALESTESDGRFMAYADGMDSLKDAGLGGLKGGIGLLDLGLTTVDGLATQLKNVNRFIGDVGTGTPMNLSEYNLNDNTLRKFLLDSGVYDKKNVQEYYADKGSDTYKLAEARIQAKQENEESDLGKFYVGLSETLKDPTLGVPMVMESLPATYSGGMIGRGIAKGAPILGDKLAGVIIPRAGALGEGVMASGMAFSDLSAQKAEQGEEVTLHDARYVPAVGAGTYAFGRLFGNYNTLDIESALANGVTKTSVAGLVPNALAEAGQEAGQGYSESVFNQMTLNNGEVDFGQAAYDAGRSSASGVYMSGMMSGPSALAGTPSAIKQGVGKVKQQFQATHDDLINPAYKKFNPAQAYTNAQTAFNKATTPEQQQQATEQMRQAEEAVYAGVSKFDELINNETDETKKKKLEESKNKWLNSQVTTLNTITDAVQSEQDEGFSASSILDNYSKLGAIQAQQEQAQAQTNTNTDVDLSQVNRPTGDMVTPNPQATQATKPNGYVKGKPVGIMGSYALKSDGKHRDTGAGTGDHYDIRLASDSKTGVKDGHRDNPVGYLNRFITSDGESLANARATSGYSKRNGRMHWGLDFGANGSFQQNQAKRTLLIAPEWEDRVVSFETRKDKVKYDKKGNRTDGGYYTRVTFDDGAVLHILHQDAKGQAQLKQAHGNATTDQQANPVQATSTAVNSSWQGKKHRNISNNTTYDSKMSSIYSQYGFTLAEQQILKAQVGQESGFDAKATNTGSGAFGLTQFIKGTAERFGVKPNDVDSMLHGQAKYMRYLLDRYKGDWAKALAGYNTGEGNVDKHWGSDGTGNGGGVMTTKWNRGNGETLLYVENILANAGTMTLNGQGGNTIQGSTDTTEQTNRLNDLLAQMDKETNAENLQKLQEQVNQLQEQIANTANTDNTANTANTQPEATQEQEQYAEQVEPQIIRRYSRMALDGDIDQAKAEVQQFQQAGVLSEEKANSLIALLDIKASIKSDTMSGVSEDIYNGSKHGNTPLENNLGLKDYERVFSSGNQKTINKYMDYLESFRDNHNAKSSILQQALAELNTTGKDQYVGRTTDGWQFITQEQYENKSANETAYQINGRSQKLVNAVTNEAKVIDSFTNNWQTILNQKGNKPVQQNNNQQQQQQVQRQQSQPRPAEPSTDVPTVPTVPTTPKPVSNTNTNSAYAKTAQEMNNPNGVWVGRNGYGKDTVSMSQVEESTQPYIGMFGSPFNKSGDHGWVLNDDDGSRKTEKEVRQLHTQKYKEKLAEYYSHGRKKWFRDAVESLRDKTLYTGMRNSSSAVEVQAISQFLEETKDMNDEEKLAYARALSQGGRDTANAIKSGKLDNTVSNRLGNTNTNTNTNTNSNQQQEPVFDENDTLDFGDSNNQQSMPEPTFNENDSLIFADDYDDVQQQLASRDDDDDADIELYFDDAPTIDSDEVIIDLDDVQETNDNNDTDTSTDTDNDIVLGEDNNTDIDITKGVHTLLDMIEHIAFTDAQLLIANAVVNKYPDHTISFDGSNADISIKTTNPETVLARLVYLATRDVLSKDPTTSKAHENVHKSLDYVINKLSQYKTTDPKEQELIQNLLQSKEALVALGTSHKEYKDLLKSIKTKERKVKDNLFSVIIHGFMSFLGVPSKATTTDLFEVLMADVGNAINLQARDNKSYVLSMVSDSATRKKEQGKPFDEQNLITSSFTQSTKGNLVNVKSLSSRLIQKGIKEIKRLGVKAPNEKQEAQLKHYLKFEQQFKQALYNTFQSKKDEYKYQDLKQFLNIGTNENPVFDDNAITAMALSAYDYIALNGGSNYTSAEDIAVLLGLDKEVLVPNYVLFKYKDAGISVNEVIIDLGKNAVKSLGLTAIDTAPAETLQRLESSIGDWILTTMLENKLAHKNTYSQQELENDRANSLGHIPKELNAYATKSTITLKPLVNELDQVIDDITELSKGTSGYLSSLYGSSTRRRNVSLVPIEETIDMIDSTSSEVSKSQMEVIKRTQKEPIKLNQGMSSLLDYFLDKNEEMLHTMFGAKVYTEEELAQQGVHISERESMIKSAEGNLRALDSYLDLREGLPTRDTVFYDQNRAVKNDRMHYNSNVFNFQSEKVHRALGEYASFETKYDSKNFINQKWIDDKGKPTAEAYLIRAIFENAEGTEDIFKEALKGKNLSEGYTVDKLSTENFMPTAWKYLTTNGKLKTAIRGIHNIQDGKKPTEPQLKAIQEVVAQWKMGANSFRALMEVANLHRAIQNNTTFVSSLGLGSDGVNSGTGIGTVQMGINDVITLQRLGLFGKDADNQTYFDTRNDTTIGDYYTAFKEYLLAEVDNLADTTNQVGVLHALKALNTSLETRKMLKAILIPFGYGAGNARLIRASAEQMIKDVYKSMSKIANEQDGDKATTAYNNLTTQLQGVFGDKFKLPPINELLEYEFNNKDYALLIEAYEVIMGEAISEAVNGYAEEFIKRRNFNINIHNAISETYVKAREHLLEQAKQKHEAKLREEYKDATENELKRVLAYNTLSTQDIYEQVDKPLQKVFPTVRTRHQVEDDLERGSIEFVKPERTFRQDISIQAITQVFSPKNKSNKDKTNQNVFIRDKVLTTTGVTPNSQMIQQQDAYVTSRAMVVNDEVSINVHDANIGKPTHYHLMAQAQNRAFFEGTAQYHMYSESIEALVSMIENITEVMGKDYVISDVAIELAVSLLGDVPNVNTTGDLIQTTVNEIITQGLSYDRGKITLLEGLGSIHQYSGEGGEVKLTDKDYEMLNEQRDVIKQHGEQLRKRIAKVSKGYQGKLGEVGDNTNESTSEILDPTTVTLHSGGAYGADTDWDIIGRKYGIQEVKHYRDSENQRLSKRLNNRGIKATILDKEQMQHARVELKELLGLVLKDSLIDNLTARNYYQVVNSDSVFAIAPLRENRKYVSGGTSTAVRLGIKLDKPTYVWDTNTLRWYRYHPKTKRFEETGTPKITKNFAGVGTRDIEYYDKAGRGLGNPKYLSDDVRSKATEAIEEVYQTSLRNVHDTASTSDEAQKSLNIWFSTGENAELSNLALRPFTLDGKKYESVEHYYQTNKSGKFNQRVYNNPRWAKGGVKIQGGKVKTDNGYNITLMKEGITLSFKQNPEALQTLLATGNDKLTHNQDTGMWGRKFPELLMEVREELANTQRLNANTLQSGTTFPTGNVGNSQNEVSSSGLISIPKVSKKPIEYDITLSDNSKETVKGYLLTIAEYPNVKFAVRKTGKYWVVDELTTGLKLTFDDIHTRADAVDSLTRWINRLLTSKRSKGLQKLKDIGFTFKDDSQGTNQIQDIYNNLPKKTVSGNVIVESVYKQKGINRAKEIGGVFSLRTDGKYHFGNPFSSDERLVKRDGLVQTNSIKESVERYIDWVINSSDERAMWAREKLKSGELKGKPIIYYKELGEPSHANALDYLINRYDWGNEVSSGVLNYEQAKQLINTLSKQDRDKLRDTVAKHLNIDNPLLKQVAEYVMEFGLPSQNLSLDTLTEQAIDNLTDDEVSATYEQNKEAIQELLQQDLLYQLDVSSDFFNRVLSEDTLKELAKLRSYGKIQLPRIRNSALPTTVKQYLIAQLSNTDYKRLTGNQLYKAFNNSYIQHQKIKQLDHELERRLVSMVKSLGYTVSVKTKQELKDKYGLGINGVFSVVQKSIEVVHANERNITTLPEEALHAIIEVANWKDNGSMLNVLYGQLHTWSEYPKIYNRYASIYTRNGAPDKNKIHKEIMAQVLSYAVTGHKDFKFYSIEYIDDGFITSILKKFIDLIGRIYDDFTGKGVDRELRKTASIIAEYLKEGNLDGIVHSRTAKGNLLNVENTLAHQRTIDNGFGEKLIQDISAFGGVITGSFGLRYFNSIFREAKDSLHDIDLYLDIKKELKATRYKNLRRDEFEDTNFFKELSKRYPHLSFATSFGAVYNNQIYQYVVTKDAQTKALIDQAIEQLKSQKKRVGIDTVTELLPEDKANQFYWLDIFIGYDIPNTFDNKLGMNFVSYEKGIAEKNALGRSKDANDYMNSYAMDTGNYTDSYFQVDETEIEYKRRILKEAVRKLHTNAPSNAGQVAGDEVSPNGIDEAYENAKALVGTLDNETKDELRAVVKETTKVDKPTFKQVAQYVVRYALNTVQDIVEHLNPSSELSAQDKLYHYLWERVQQLNPNLKVVTRDDFPDSSEEGYYDPVENIIYLNKKVPDDQKIRVLNHEIFHALTETGLTQDTQAGRELKAIYDYLKGKANGKFTTQLQDINEFVAYAMTDKVFADWVVKTMDLKEIGIKARQANKLQYFVGVVMRALGLSKYKTNVNTLTQLINDVMVEYDPDNVGNVIRHSQRQDATARVNSTNTLDIFKNLPTNVSEAHNEHLNYVVDNIIGTYQNTHSKPMVNIANGKLRNTSLLNGFKSSDKEAYITDALIIVFESYLKAHTGSMAVNGLNNLYRDAIKQYASVKDLFPNFATASKEDKAQMTKMYNFIFNNKTKQDNVARFMAMTLANEQFRQLMQSGRKPMRDSTTWFDKAMRVLDKVVNWFNRVYFGSRSNKHSDITDAMTKRLVNLDTKARNTSVDWLQVGWTKALEFAGKVLDKPVKKLGYLLMDKVIKQFAGSTGRLGTLGNFAKLQSDIKSLKELEKEDAELDGEIPLHESVVNRLLSVTYGDERYKIVRDTLNEVTMYGKRGKWIENMVRLTQSIGKVRQAMKESTIRVFDEVFETPLTKEQKSDITKVVLRTELSSLVRHGFSIEKVASMFEQVTLNKTIDNYAKQLIKKVGYTKANDMLMQSKALGYYMAKESTVRNMTKSAQGIAIGLGTDYQTDFSNMDNDVFMLVDVLSTLYALDYTDKSARQSVKALLENEPLAMNTVLQLQKGLVDKGRDEFEHNPLNYQKGYTPQITNPYRKLVWVTTPDEIKMLKAQGFEEVTKLTKDKLDDTDQRTLMLHTAYSPNNYVSGGLDLADSHARGTTVYEQGIDDREIAKVTKANVAMRKQRNQGSYMNYDPSVDRNVMVATYATDGAILDYHYEMVGNTRDIYLERDNSFDELMGTLHGNLEFKPQIMEHQANIAKEIFKEAKANFAKNPNEFVLLDFDNPDPAVQEAMKLLPYSFREEIIKHFGDGVVPVHKSVYTSMFGFRAYSIANMFDKLHDPEQKLNRAEKLITGIFRAFSEEKARQRAVQLEKLIQDFVSVIKDYIVIRSGGVLMGNIISNFLLLSLHGINPIKILKDSIFAWRNSNRYIKTQAKVNDLNTRLLGLTNKQEIGLIKRELKALQRELENNPMHEFMQAGLMSTIVEDLTNQDNKYKTPIQGSMDKYLDKIPKPIRSTFDTLTIGKGTLLHGFLSDATQFSDLSAKYALAKHNMDKGMDISNAIYESQINFINYDMPTNQFLDYMNRMGFMMFTKFFLRFQQVMLKLFTKMPVTALAQHYAIEQLGGQGIYEPFIFNRFGNPFDDSIFMADNAFADVITADLVF